VTRLRLDDRGSILGRIGFFLPSPPRPDRPWGPSILPSNRYRSVSFPGVKWPGCEGDHLTASSGEVKNAWSYTSTPSVRINGVVLS
jgi:hypothetical protein